MHVFYLKKYEQLYVLIKYIKILVLSQGKRFYIFIFI